MKLRLRTILIIPFFVASCIIFVMLHKQYVKRKVNKAKVQDFQKLTMQNWNRKNWTTALEASTKLNNPWFHRAILADFLLNHQEHTDYILQLEKFLHNNPTWHTNKHLIVKAENYLHELTDKKALQWCLQYPPTTTAGKKYYLNLLIKTKKQDDQIKKLVKNIWQNSVEFNINQEKKFLSKFANYLDIQDHYTKVDNMLFQDQFNHIEYFISLLNTADQKIIRARMRMKKGFWYELEYKQYMQKNGYSAGLIYDFLSYKKNKKEYEQVIEKSLSPMLSQTIEKDCHTKQFANLRVHYARELLVMQKYQMAYDILKWGNPAIDSEEYLKVNHLAGFIALTKLKNKNLALKHFMRIQNLLPFASINSRNNYFLYMCTKNAQCPTIKKRSLNYLHHAANNIATFYGQVANHTLRIEKIDLNHLNQTIKHPYTYNNIDNVKSELEFIYTICVNKRYKLADKLITNLFTRLNKTQIFKCINYLMPASKEVNWQMMLSQSALNRGVVIADKLFPKIDMPNEIAQQEIHLMYAIIRKESVFDQKALSDKNAIGLMQLQQDTAHLCLNKMKMKYGNLYDPKTNIILGHHYIKLLKNIYNQNTMMTLAAYHAGRENVKRWIKQLNKIAPNQDIFESIVWIESIPFFATQQYIQNVIRNKNMYFALDNNGQLSIKSDFKCK